MNVSADSPVEKLFVRYWDNALTAAEADELATLLTRDPAARDLFQFLSMQAVAAAELPADRLPAPDENAHTRAPKEPRNRSRRQMLGVLGGGMAAGVGALALGRWFWHESIGKASRAIPVRVTGARGAVTVRTADGRVLPSEGAVPTGATVSTRGLGATAVLAYQDGSSVSLLNDSVITVHESGRLLLLHQGTASAELRPRADDQRLTLTTALLALARVNDTAVTVGNGKRSTEIEVHHGSVSVSAPTGEPMAVVRGGELLTVGANGVRTQQPIPETPDAFSWDLTKPLPDGWLVGRREVAAGVPLVRCEAWPDPYYGHTVMHQIRSAEQWGRGLFRLTDGSSIHVRYRAERDAPKGQVCMCVRTAQSRCSDTGMLEYNGGFAACAAGEWRWLRIPAAAMLSNKHAPGFGAPWVGFLVIFNTFETDVGLEIAEFRVLPPGK